MTQKQPFFDGHNDVLTRLYDSSVDEAVQAFVAGNGKGHIDLPRMQEGGLVGGLFALFVSPKAGNGDGLDFSKLKGKAFDLPLPPMMPVEIALPVVMRQAALLRRFVNASNGQLQLCTTATQIHQALSVGSTVAVMHMEGAECLDEDLLNLDILYAAGLRSLGPVWSRPTRFAHGVPFKFPGSPDTGPGLSSDGEALVKRCNELKVVIDLSHINEKGFWDVAQLSNSPLVASHSNAHALCPSTRNLTDAQLEAIASSNGFVGVNFATSFLRSDGQMRRDTELSTVLSQLDYLMEKLGEDRVGFGSDFDGAIVPQDIGSAAGLPTLAEAMRAHGYNDELMDKLCLHNWIRLLERTWGS
ncbi:MAG: dipeptidase [Gammaproteobacteria bacterium]|nr:dipeptidase [Gammaproteobacteria bacterium]